MKRTPPLLSATVGLSFLSSISFADVPAKVPIWKLSDEDSTVFLAGSIHMLREVDLPIPEAFDKVYDEAEEIVFELDMAKMANPKLAADFRKEGALPPGETLSDHLPDELVKRLHSYLAKAGMPTRTLDRFKPGFVLVTLSSLEAARQQAQPDLGLETTFYRKSVTDGKPSRGLETMLYQLSRFEALGKETITSMIETTLDEAESGEGSFQDVLDAWRGGDAEELDELIVSKMDDHPRALEILLTERNRNWIPEIVSALATDRDVMFLVGAAHLVGDDGVIEMLKEKGLHAVQLNSSAKSE